MANQSDPPTKALLRRHYRTLLDEMTADNAAARSAELVAHLAAWLGDSPGVVAVFAALPGEPDLALLHRRCAGARWVYPRVAGEDLVFHEVASHEHLRTGHFGILEPVPGRHPVVPTEAVDCFLCPALAFALNGVRLGRGKGFYDRALAAARPHAPRIGVGFAMQQCAELPSEPHDQRMTQLASEEGVSAIDRLR